MFEECNPLETFLTLSSRLALALRSIVHLRVWGSSWRFRSFLDKATINTEQHPDIRHYSPVQYYKFTAQILPVIPHQTLNRTSDNLESSACPPSKE